MKHKRAQSAHIAKTTLISGSTQPSSPKKNKLQDINDRINSMFLKAKNPNDQNQTQQKLNQQFQFSKIFKDVSKDKLKQEQQLIQRDQQIKMLQSKIQEINFENQQLKQQIKLLSSFQSEFESIKLQSSNIVKENQGLKKQIHQLQTTFSYLQSSNLLSLGQSIFQQIEVLEHTIKKCFRLLEYSCQQDYSNLQLLVNINQKQIFVQNQEKNLYNLLTQSLEYLKKILFETEKSFEFNYNVVSTTVFNSNN